MSKDEFIKRIDNKEFIEWEEVYENTYYGTLISELENSSQKNLIFDIDVVGGLNIKKKFPKQTITIFIKPPSINELEARLINRNLDSDSSIKTRIDKAKDEILLADKYFFVLLQIGAEVIRIMGLFSFICIACACLIILSPSFMIIRDFLSITIPIELLILTRFVLAVKPYDWGSSFSIS